MPEVPVDLGEWSEGTEMHAELSLDDVNAALGLIKGHFEGLNRTEDPDGLLDGWTEQGRKMLASDRALPLEPRWHQRIGVLRMLECLFARLPVLLMDEVGVGKTAQAICLLAIYVWYVSHHNAKGCFPGKFSEYIHVWLSRSKR